jgi:hypothetical protein
MGKYIYSDVVLRVAVLGWEFEFSRQPPNEARRAYSNLSRLIIIKN